MRMGLSHSTAVMALVRALIDGDPLGAKFANPPVMLQLMEAARERTDGGQPGEITPETAAAAVLAFGVGWIIMQPRIMKATGRTPSSEELGRIVSTILDMA